MQLQSFACVVLAGRAYLVFLGLAALGGCASSKWGWACA